MMGGERGKKKVENGKKKRERENCWKKEGKNREIFLFISFFIPPLSSPRGGDQVSDRVDTAIDYIQTLKARLEMNKMKKEQLMRSYQHTLTKKSKSVDVQIIEQVSPPDVDAVLIRGLKNHSDFSHVIQLLNHYSTEVTLANFSTSGHSIFHIRHKKIEAEEMSKRIKILTEGSSNMKELELQFQLELEPELELELGNDNIDGWSSSSNLSIWDFDLQSNIWGWGWELEMFREQNLHQEALEAGATT
ncbi:hypothetical protein OSB04_021736 [Centaurea solstitialis]|uniref:BHLH domain-containing protein n=1 Tax=Centaurea solstitialis TaxID=347529 RepID=A0AA38SV19_9ASTR|nr:hypothetical protein OSB04_021736 [Centaurea solstitialis]